MFAFDIYKGLESWPKVKFAPDFVLSNMADYDLFLQEKERCFRLEKRTGVSTHLYEGTEYTDAFVVGDWQDDNFVVIRVGTMTDKNWYVVEDALRKAMS